MIFRNCCSLVPPGGGLGLVLAQRADEVVRVVADRLVGRDVLDRRAQDPQRGAQVAQRQQRVGVADQLAHLPPTPRPGRGSAGSSATAPACRCPGPSPIGGSVLVSSARRGAQAPHQLGGVVEEAAAGAQAGGALRQRSRHPLDGRRQRGGVAVQRRERVRAVAQQAAAAAGATGATCAVVAPSSRTRPAEARAAVRQRRHHRGQAPQQRRARGDRLVQRLPAPGQRVAQPLGGPAQVAPRVGGGRRRRRPRTPARPRCGPGRSVSPAAMVRFDVAGRELDELDAQRRARPHPRRWCRAPAARPSCPASCPRSPPPCRRRSRPAAAAARSPRGSRPPARRCPSPASSRSAARPSRCRWARTAGRCWRCRPGTPPRTTTSRVTAPTSMGRGGER